MMGVSFMFCSCNKRLIVSAASFRTAAIMSFPPINDVLRSSFIIIFNKSKLQLFQQLIIIVWILR